MEEQEVWKEYPLNTNYFVSNLGRVKNKRGHLMSLCQGSNGYLFIRTYNKGEKKIALIHRMVMITFNYVDNYEQLTVDHINGKRQDNRLNNLRWMSLNDNLNSMKDNRTKLNCEINRLLEKYGYDKLIEILSKIGLT